MQRTTGEQLHRAAGNHGVPWLVFVPHAAVKLYIQAASRCSNGRSWAVLSMPPVLAILYMSVFGE